VAADILNLNTQLIKHPAKWKNSSDTHKFHRSIENSLSIEKEGNATQALRTMREQLGPKTLRSMERKLLISL
jgi:hypothetical protein